ncbi:MAG TPA: hypothetical protein VM661_18985 [Candidatus Sulfotelmatobacter sp.]|jgi:hypothetical protein|nr:hypothetical protein [Candidatus Sulfotelmatobacter sp.]
MFRRLTAPLVAIAAFATLTACAGEVPWVNPNLPRKMAEHDYMDCRHYADSEVGTGAGGGYFDDERSSDPMSMADRAVTRRQMDGIINACMRDKGYFPKK